MACRADPGTCRRDHIARPFRGAEYGERGFDATCLVCGHDTYRCQAPDRSRSLRHIWTCACKRCGCDGTRLRAAMLQAGIDPGCLGSYSGDTATTADPDRARRIEQAALDVLALQGQPIGFIKLILAEAVHGPAPDGYADLVRWLQDKAGVTRSEAYRTAERWTRAQG